MLSPKKVGTLRSEGSDEEKQTNEIKTAKPLLDVIDIAGRTITADAFLTQRELANYLVGRGANYHFTAKGNQPTLLEAIAYYFQTSQTPADFIQIGQGEHGHIDRFYLSRNSEIPCRCWSRRQFQISHGWLHFDL